MVEIEAQSLGKGIIATDLGFSSEAIRDGVNGRKVPLGDVDRFVQVIREVWENPAMCASLGENARRDYEDKYRPEDNYSQLMRVYADVLASS